MKDEVTISLSITPTWSILKEVQEKTLKFMNEKGISREISDATIMCASELIENAIKYGAEKPGGGNINFDLTTEGKKVAITVSNGIKSDKDKENVIQHIDRIKKSNDPSKLYTERLMHLMENPKPGVSQLGLYRIAYEGEFVLNYKLENEVLSIIAVRELQ